MENTCLIINPELALQLRLLGHMDGEFISDLIMSMIETLNGIKQDPDEMPTPVREVYTYWVDSGRINELRVNDVR